jgi:hypothetical protein
MSSNIIPTLNNFDITPTTQNYDKENISPLYNFAPFLFLNKNDSLPNNINELKNNYDDKNYKLYNHELLEKNFFSNVNINYIQTRIKNNILLKMNIQIPNQNYEHLKAIMKDIYDTKAQYLSTNIDKQIDQLNDIVINFCIISIEVELKSYIKFLQDSTSPYTNLDRP